MATITEPNTKHVERFYAPSQLATASPLRRLSAYLIEAVLPAAVFFVLYTVMFASLLAGGDSDAAAGGAAFAGLILLVAVLGYVVWWIVSWTRGQTPGKQILSMYVIREDGTRAGGWLMFVREVLVKGVLINGLLGAITLGIGPLVAALWLTWDRNNQALWDKITSTYVAYSPHGFMPLPRSEGPPPSPHSSIGPLGVTEQLRDLSRLQEEGIITDEEYEQRRQRLVDRL